MTAYWELLRDPRWQEMRLRVMDRDGFSCLECGAKDKTLNVHHTYYAKGRKPWEYEPEALRTMCEDCHSHVSDRIDEAKRLIGQLSIAALEEAIGYLRSKAWLERYDNAGFPIQNTDQAIGLCEAFGVIGEWMQSSICGQLEQNGWLVRRPDIMLGIGREQAQHLRAYYDRNGAEAAAKKEADLEEGRGG